ncbi:DUF3971 domain-containing protein [Chelatococcus sp. GCM10030263]|uniref:YhdP family protein n=1 Tax=Chelatococcus sp. GCM10030263 TaxID=3273387 RepID=UPI00360D0A97
MLLAVAIVALRFALGPIPIAGADRTIAAELATRLGPGWSVKVADTAIEYTRHGPTLRLDNVDLRNPRGLSVLRAQTASIAVSPWGLLRGQMSPRSVEFSGLDLRLFVARDGGLTMSAGEADPPEVEAKALAPSSVPTAEPPADSSDAARKQSLPLAVAAVSFIDLVSGSETFAGALERVRLSGARLTLIDETKRQRIRFDDVSFHVERPRSGELHFGFGLKGRHGPWQVSGTVLGGTTGTDRKVSMSVDDVPVSDLLALGGFRAPVVTTDMPLSGKLELAIAPDDSLRALDATLRGGRGILAMDDPDQPPIAVDDLALHSSWDAAAGELVISSAEFHAGDTHLALAGRVSPAQDGHSWRMALTGRDAQIESLDGGAPVAIDDLSLTLTGAAGGGVIVEKAQIAGPEYAMALSGSFGTASDDGGLTIKLAVEPSAVRRVLRFWPAFVASDVRKYLIENMPAGKVDHLTLATRLSSEALDAARHKKPIPDEAVSLDFGISGGTLRPAPGLPPLTQISATGRVTGRTALIHASQASIALQGRALTLTDGVFKAADLAPPVTAQIGFHLNGPADALVALLKSDVIRETVPIDFDPAKVRGQADIDIALTLPLVNTLSPADVQATASGNLTNLTIENIRGKDRLEGANLALAVDQTTLSLKGNGQIAGVPASIDVNQVLRSHAGEATIAFVLDEAARLRKGIDLGSKLKGPVGVTIKTGLAGDAPTAVDVDLTRASIDNLLPGWRKSAGRSARLAFTLLDNDGYELRDVALDGAVTAKGNVKLTADGALREASFSQFKLSPGDDLKLDVSRNRSAYRVVVRGNLLDARPFLQVISGDTDSGSSFDFDLDLAVNILAGYNDEAIANAGLKLGRRGKAIRDFSLSGKLGSASVSARLGGSGAQQQIFAETANAGSALRFLDLYKRMVGGHLQLSLSASANDNQDGVLTIRDFSLRNEQGLQRIIAQSPNQGNAPALDASDIRFTKLKVDFTRLPGRINVREGVVWGPTVGVSLEGHLDTTSDRLDLSGTYVPAYALNNIFSQLPIVGLILGGGQYEGLFAVNFRVTGPAAAPVMSINPLSAIAPGIFRKFFDLGRADSGQTNAIPLRPER